VDEEITAEDLNQLVLEVNGDFDKTWLPKSNAFRQAGDGRNCDAHGMAKAMRTCDLYLKVIPSRPAPTPAKPASCCLSS